MFSSKLPAAPAVVMVASLPMTWAHENRLGHHGVDLAGHDARPGLQVGQMDLAKPGPGSRTHPAQVVADLGQADGQDLGGPAEGDQSILGGLGLEVVPRLPERPVGGPVQPRDHRRGEPRRRVQPGADRGPSQRQLGGTVSGQEQPFPGQLDLAPVAAELLAESDRHRVHQVCPARLDDPCERDLTTVQDG